MLKALLFCGVFFLISISAIALPTNEKFEQMLYDGVEQLKKDNPEFYTSKKKQLSNIAEKLWASSAELKSTAELISNFEPYQSDELLALVRYAEKTIYFSSKLLSSAKNDDALALMIAHEMAHVTLGHWKEAQMNWNKTIAKIKSEWQRTQSENAAMKAGLETFLIEEEKKELQADKIALRYVENAGYSLESGINFFIYMLENAAPPKEKSPLASYTDVHLQLAAKRAAGFRAKLEEVQAKSIENSLFAVLAKDDVAQK